MHKITKLPPEIQKRICAGEVIVSPYNVLKELIENSIDAESTFISINVSKDNLNIEVHDNGHGIEEEDFKNLVLAHHTSKFSNSTNYGENFFGFRGEALSSIRCISHLTIKSKVENKELGYERNFTEDSLKPISMNTGTSIYIKYLFYNNKIREKCFHKKLSVYKSMSELANIFAIKNPNIKFLFNDSTCSYNDVSIGKINYISDINYLDFIKTIKFTSELQFNDENDLITKSKSKQIGTIYQISSLRYYSNKFITLIFTPTMINFKSFQFILFINNRLVTSQSIKSFIGKIYSNILPKGRYPFIYLEIRIPSEYIDVNVHPSKKEVLLDYEDELLNVLGVILEMGLNEPKETYKGGISNSNVYESNIIYKEYNTLLDCLPSQTTCEYKLLSIQKLKNEIVEIDKSFIQDLVYVGTANIPDINLLVQYNQYLMKCNLTSLIPHLIYHFFLFNFGNFTYSSCCIKSKIKDDTLKKMLQEYFKIEIDDNNNFIHVPNIGDYIGDVKEWENFNIENKTEEKVFREIFSKLCKIYRNLELNRQSFSTLKKYLKCTKDVLQTFTKLKSLKDLYKCFERC